MDSRGAAMEIFCALSFFQIKSDPSGGEMMHNISQAATNRPVTSISARPYLFLKWGLWVKRYVFFSFISAWPLYFYIERV